MLFLGGFGCGVAATLILAVAVGHRGQARVKVSNMDTVGDLTMRPENAHGHWLPSGWLPGDRIH